MLKWNVAMWWNELSEEEQHLLIELLHSLDLMEFGIKVSAKGQYVKK